MLAPGGMLIITFLPNRFSYSETLSKALRRTHHVRRYTRRGIRGELAAARLEVVADGYHQLLPSFVSRNGGGASARGRGVVDRLYEFNPNLERLPLLNRVAANIYVIAHKPA